VKPSIHGIGVKSAVIEAVLKQIAIAAVLVCLACVPANANAGGDCFSDDFSRRVDACSALIGSPGLSDADLALAYSARALAYSVQGQYGRAIPDYDASLKLDPDSAIALNNRAWAYFKSGQPERGATDVEKALALLPDSPHTLDTRAHILQSRGETGKAMRDYERAMRFGGEHIVKLYQCGLQANSLFEGEIDGLYTSAMRKALETCISTTGCDPLPADEECRKVTS
jgi:tetratricopeptide (TPR) repeat protein